MFNTVRTALARRLVALKAAGCDVAVLLNNTTHTNIQDELRSVRHQSVESLHSKYVIVSAKMRVRDGTAVIPTKLVASGSAAMGTNDRSEDTWVEIEDSNLYNAFRWNWFVISWGINPTPLLPPVPIPLLSLSLPSQPASGFIDSALNEENGTVHSLTFCERAYFGAVGRPPISCPGVEWPLQR